MSDLFKNEPALLKVALLGNPVLRKKVENVTREELKDPRTAYFIDSMIDTMREYNGAGLASPQVHVSKKIIIIEAQDNPRYPKRGEIPLTVLVNPEIVSFSQEVEEGWEGCLSVAGLWGRVKRSTAITVNAMTREGKDVEIKAEGFFAVVLQHEIDHLYGKLFVDRMEDMSTLCFTQEYNRYWSD
ncbi:MAG: peptide deformylase [Nitrospinae bacterium]|nr:peptide deformylase [Nitrospinota bacterium]